ncbi:MAG: histidine kinase [Tissierellia bacterium]|nr:histidine kinase [Tissierellia bacterium]
MISSSSFCVIIMFNSIFNYLIAKSHFFCYNSFHRKDSSDSCLFWSINIISEVFPIFIFICHKCIISYHLLIHLGNCFKKNLKQDLEEIEFVEEIEYIKSYLEIEKARFQDKLNVIFDIPEDFNCYIPPRIIML